MAITQCHLAQASEQAEVKAHTNPFQTVIFITIHMKLLLRSLMSLTPVLRLQPFSCEIRVDILLLPESYWTGNINSTRDEVCKIYQYINTENANAVQSYQLNKRNRKIKGHALKAVTRAVIIKIQPQWSSIYAKKPTKVLCRW